MSDSESSKEQIVIACQALGLHGCGSGIGGHVSMRAPGENAIWINAFDRTLAEITIDDVLLIDFDGNVLEGNREVSIGVTSILEFITNEKTLMLLSTRMDLGARPWQALLAH